MICRHNITNARSPIAIISEYGIGIKYFVSSQFVNSMKYKLSFVRKILVILTAMEFQVIIMRNPDSLQLQYKLICEGW